MMRKCLGCEQMIDRWPAQCCSQLCRTIAAREKRARKERRPHRIAARRRSEARRRRVRYASFVGPRRPRGRRRKPRLQVERQVFMRECPCGAMFETRWAHARYCSRSCSRTAMNRRHKASRKARGIARSRPSPASAYAALQRQRQRRSKQAAVLSALREMGWLRGLEIVAPGAEPKQ